MVLKKNIKKIMNKKSYDFAKRKYFFVKNILLLVYNFHLDAILYFFHSTVFFNSDFKKYETKIILYYHAIEKGFLYDSSSFRPKFAQEKVAVLIRLLKKQIVIDRRFNSSQALIAYNVICKYYEKHLGLNKDISDFYKLSDYNLFNSLREEKVEIINEHEKFNYFENSSSDFRDFSISRNSVRIFKKEIIKESVIKSVVDLCRHAPSVCNRQPNKVIYVSNKHKINKLLDIQGGLKGYEDTIHNLMIVTSDRNFFYTVGERNQLYIDGGIFVMNLLYSLHYYKIAACPAHWGFTRQNDLRVQKELKLKNSEKVICFVAIGNVADKFNSCLSRRRNPSEILEIIN